MTVTEIDSNMVKSQAWSANGSPQRQRQRRSTPPAEKFENAALFLRFTYAHCRSNPSRKQSFSKTLFKPKEFENAAQFAFSCGRKTFWKRSFLKRMESRLSFDFPIQVFLKHKSKIINWWLLYVFKFLWRSVGGKHLVHFQSETTVFKFLRRSTVDGTKNKLAKTILAKKTHWKAYPCVFCVISLCFYMIVVYGVRHRFSTQFSRTRLPVWGWQGTDELALSGLCQKDNLQLSSLRGVNFSDV